MLIHSIVLGSALALANGMAIRPAKPSFHWNVSIIEASLPSPVTSEQQITAASPPAASTSPPDIQTDHHRAQNTASTRSPDRLTSRIPAQSNTDAPVFHDVDASPQIPAETMERTVSFGNDSIAAQSTRGTAAQELSADTVPLTEADASDLPPPDVSAQEQSSMAQVHTIVEEKTVLHRPPVTERPVRSLNTMPDYGWLAEALWAKVEHLKRYPPIARMNRWEGKVILHAVILEDGRLLDVDIVESSGHAMLDQDAMEVLRRVSPLKLQHPLEQFQVVLQIPISYRLD